MTIDEFSALFDILAASYRRFTDFDAREAVDTIEFNEYEKSVYLTKALELYVKELYNGSTTGKSYEINEERRRQLNNLVIQKTYDESQALEVPVLNGGHIHTTFALPEDCWYIVYEQVIWAPDTTCFSNKAVDVVPITHDEYWRVLNNPFRGPNTKRVLRLDNGSNQVELVSTLSLGGYIIRYLKKPEPIILVDLPDNLTIEGVSNAQTCKLSENLHLDILETAVRLATINKRVTTTSDSKKGD